MCVIIKVMGRILCFIFMVMFMRGLHAKSIDCELAQEMVREKEFYAKLYNPDGINSAKTFLGKNKLCVNSDYEKAIYSESWGEIYRIMYLKSRNISDYEKAISFYDEALSYKTKHDEYALWHKSLILLEAKKYQDVVTITNKLFDIGSEKNMGLYFGTALEVSVLTRNWEVSQKLVNILYNRDNTFYVSSITLLMPTVITLCHYNRSDMANAFINNVSKLRPEMTSNLNYKNIVNFYENECKRL